MTRNIAQAVISLILAISSLFAVRGFATEPRVLITAPIDESRLVTLVGNTRFEAISRNDRGRAAENFAVNHLLLQLKRAPELEREFAEYVESLTDKSSPNFRHWITAAEQGKRYGLAKQDIETITGWLESQGFHVGHVYPNRMVIDFSGTAGQINKAFHTEIHHLEVKGERHIANMSDPKVPEALARVVAGIVSLHDFKPHADVQRAQYSFLGCGLECYALVPADFQTIYNISPLYTGGIYGQGETVVVIEDTDTYGTDWQTYQSTFGLTPYGGKLTTVHPNDAGNCTDPGINGDDVEANLDAEMVTAAAPGANVEVASCSDTTTTFGGLIAVENLVSAGSPPPIISMSYGLCEAGNGAASNAAFGKAFQSAAAAGVSIFVSAGDFGPFGCAAYFTVGSQYAVSGIGVTGWGDSPYNVSVGGTDFEDQYNQIEGGKPQSTYWSATNRANYGSALSYIPEVPWNDSCAGYLAYNASGFATPYGTSGFCSSGTGLVDTIAGGGGPSSCATGTANPDNLSVEDTSCKGYAKPSWQKGILGNPADGVRDIPDVSLFASNGFWGHYVIICYSDPFNGGVPCTGAPSGWIGIGGTSASAPMLAAIQALVNQKWGTRVGNPNPTYYSIARTEYGASGNSNCYSINETAENTCVFNDITQGDNNVDCIYNGTYKADCYLPSGFFGTQGTQAIAKLNLKAGGSGYTSTPKCTITAPSNKSKYLSPAGTTIYAGGTTATCTATIDTSTGAVNSVVLNNKGAGYSGVPICTISGGGGAGAKCMAVITPTTGAATYQPAYGATPGWDMATGLGSVNAYNLVEDSAWK